MIHSKYTIPDLEFDAENLKFHNLENNDVISMKFYDQHGVELDTQMVFNGIFYYLMMRSSATFDPEYQSSIEFKKTHPSCN